METEEKVDRRPVVAPRYESGGEAQAQVLMSVIERERRWFVREAVLNVLDS